MEKEKKNKTEKKNGRVLLIYTPDDSIVYSVLCHALSERHELLKADTGLEGLEKFQQNKVQLVVIDSELEDIKYYDLIRQIRRKNRIIPIILLVEWQDDQTWGEIRQLNYKNQKRVAICKKPFIVKKFINRVHKLVSLSRRVKRQQKQININLSSVG